ncbi:SCO family protein [Aquabacter sp. L1I39]|uniref:SCO family protein n=1 Tax=Aquabacter sp. L1I39 TaxID=2820278 RepID=UPI001ADCC8D8|nr:SCO family protein [Aquabacter sp. L1I39]QTL02831.1 SCO family protein [Aquabacter sp. L1I39]
MSPRSKLLIPLSAFAVGALLLVIAATALMPSRQTGTGGSGSASVGGPFRLVDQTGATVTEADLKGKLTLIFFGFTHCPDICPTSLFEMSEILNALGPDASKVQAMFVTVDPERDTPEVMKAYLSSFNPQVRGLSGTPEQIDAIKRAYRVYSKKVPLDGGDYTMDHTAVIYLMDKSGSFLAPFNAKRPPAEAAADLRRNL